MKSQLQVKFIRFPDNILDRLDLKGPKWGPGDDHGGLRCAGHTGGSSGKAGIETVDAGCKSCS